MRIYHWYVRAMIKVYIVYYRETNPTGWWMSEKLDGVRAYWNGKCFYSRLGNAFFAPSWFTKVNINFNIVNGRLPYKSRLHLKMYRETEIHDGVLYLEKNYHLKLHVLYFEKNY